MRLHWHRWQESWRQHHVAGFKNGGFRRVGYQCARCGAEYVDWKRASLANDRTPVRVLSSPPAPPPGSGGTS